MRELSSKEIDFLFDFTRKKRVRYKDVQFEIVDHLASAIEEKLGDKEPCTFEKALTDVYSSFGIFGFAKIVEEKEKAMGKFWRIRFLGYLKDFFLLPKLIGTTGSMILCFLLLYYQFISISMLVNLLGITAFISIIWVCFHNYANDENIRDYLYLRSYYTLVGSLLYFSTFVPMQLLNDFKQGGNNLAELSIFIFLAMLTPLTIIFTYLTMVKIPKELIRDFNLRNNLSSKIWI